MGKNDEDFVDKMLKEEPQEGIIKNVGVLNFKDLTEEEMEKIKGIQNIGVLIVPAKLIGRFSAKITKNMGVIVPYVEGMRLYVGETRINADTLKNLKEPIAILQAGELVFEKDVTPELIQEKIKDYRNWGETEVPPNAYGALMSKCSENMGKIDRTLEE